MISYFEDEAGKAGSAHLRFQEWRAANPAGFVLNVQPPGGLLLHTAACTHFGNTEWVCDVDGRNSLTKRRKVCSLSPQELIDWTVTEHSRRPSPCATCKPIANDPANASTDWSQSELRQSVRAYLEMSHKYRAGENVNKAQIYRSLAEQFGRSAKAFEYRMCNISYVLAVQGRAWLPGLLPRTNVGADVAEKIERFLAEEEGRHYRPETVFEVQVQSKRKGRKLDPPSGNAQPTTIATTTTQYVRDVKVKAWVLQNAEGICECCKTQAPFVDSEGLPYLEVHHVVRLADGGKDTVANTVAVCPNCHRQLHHGKDAGDLVQSLRHRLRRLAADKKG